MDHALRYPAVDLLGHDGRRARHAGRPGRSDSAATAVEYALTVGLIALVIVGSVTTFGLAVLALFDVPCPLSEPCP